MGFDLFVNVGEEEGEEEVSDVDEAFVFSGGNDSEVLSHNCFEVNFNSLIEELERKFSEIKNF